MLTYDLNHIEGPLYKALYECIIEDIREGKLSANEKLPSKRALARNLGISTITVENTYEQLIGEGYLYSIPKKGYFVAQIGERRPRKLPEYTSLHIQMPAEKQRDLFDFSSNRTESTSFPFSIWARLMREVISVREKELLEVSPCSGVAELRKAIAGHLSSFRGMSVDPDQIIVGAGTEYLYGMLIKLLGKDKIYGIENPGYRKLMQIYESNGVTCRWADMDQQGILVDQLRSLNVDVAHISPTHHFPTGIIMPIARRYEILSWADERDGRYIIEDDYDSEFRRNGNPIPPLQSIDDSEKVIYMNTFSKSLAATIRISYMVLPRHLATRYYQELSYYSCTVSTFEQYTLAAFISRGYFEKHINRMRLHYGRKREQVLDIIKEVFPKEQIIVREKDSGLHMILECQTKMSDNEVKQRLLQQQIRISAITDFDMSGKESEQHRFLLNYSCLDMEHLKQALIQLKNILDNEHLS